MLWIYWIHVLSIEIIKEVNEHSILYLESTINTDGIAPEELESETDWLLYGTNSKDTIVVKGHIKKGIIFHGYPTKVSVRLVNGVHHFKIEAAPQSKKLDVKIKSRSFQNLNQTYEDIRPVPKSKNMI